MAFTRDVLARLIQEDDGQDLVEYGLLVAIFGTAAALVFPNIVPRMRVSYLKWGTQVQQLWIPRPPQ